MRILHTSDWHIGKKLNNKSRLDEQAEVLAEICELCDEQKTQLVIIAGDIFDTYLPSAEAEELFFATVCRLATPERAVIIISGNHDDWQRLCASRNLASKNNVYIFGGILAPSSGSAKVYASECGVNHAVITDGKESLYVGLLPYPGEQKLGEKSSDIPYQERMREWITQCFEQNVNEFAQIFVSHLFMLGGVSGESERQIDLGGARVVDRDLIPKNVLYTALGHLHKRQIIDGNRNIIYSGSPLQYSYDEILHEKSVTFFEVDCKNKEVKNLNVVPLEKGKRLVKCVALSVEEGKKLLGLYSNCHVELTLKLSGVLSDRETRELSSEYPSLNQLKLEIISSEQKSTFASRKNLNDSQLFNEYYKKKFSEQAPQKLLEAYLEVLSEVKK